MVSAQATILNVNDHEQTRYLVGRMLRLVGHDVLEAANGEDALRLAQVRTPDLVILDVKLPDVSGFEVARLIKSRPETSSIIVLQTSATFVTAAKKVEGLESGADAYLAHPFEPAELLATVKALLRLRRAEQELRRRADELVQADRRKDEFLAMLAHELRNPLAAIVTATALLEPTRHDETRFRRVGAILERQSRHLSRLVDDLLDVSRITRGRIELRTGVVEVAAPLQEAIAANRTLLESRAQPLALSLEERSMPVDADATRLVQVFTNLVDNASKYSDRGSPIEVSLTREKLREGRYAVVRVRDRGIGIAPPVLPHVFDLFVQADESLERSRGGMGIGLTLVKRLVELHGGEVRAHSEGLGQGSEFAVWLPLSAAEVPPTPAAQFAVPVAKPAVRRILVVEDNPDAREMLQTFLELAGFEVDTASDGPSGLERALAGHHEAAIVDVGLPGLNGYQVAEKIRAARRSRPIYLIALTGYGGAEQRDRAIGSGFDAHLVKPVEMDTLLRVLAERPH